MGRSAASYEDEILPKCWNYPNGLVYGVTENPIAVEQSNIS